VIYEAVRSTGRCVVCGKKLTEPGRRRHCCRSHRRRAYFSGPWMKFVRKSAEVIDNWEPYIAERLRLDPEDGRLEQIVLKLAANGKLNAYVGAKGTVTAIGIPKAKA
jgi:hypothetical protein